MAFCKGQSSSVNPASAVFLLKEILLCHLAWKKFEKQIFGVVFNKKDVPFCQETCLQNSMNLAD
jgi:hypothetical protein